MFIVITGTPGTGKTAVAKILAKKIGARLITTNYLIKKYKIHEAFDKTRKTKIIDTKKLSVAAKREATGCHLMIFEGHLSHFVPADVKIVLRTAPADLEKRLKRKGWSKKKIRENVEAEAIGVISLETKGLEIDTTKKSANETALLLARLLNKYSLQKRYVRRIDWSKQYAKYLGE